MTEKTDRKKERGERERVREREKKEKKTFTLHALSYHTIKHGSTIEAFRERSKSLHNELMRRHLVLSGFILLMNGVIKPTL